MDSQVVAQPHGHHTYEHDPQNAGLHPAVEGEEHHEKKSVLKKVKAKAKKLRDTITKHGHGHDHDHDHDHDHREGQYNTPDDHDLEEEDDDDDDDEETAEDPEIHGAPIYESAAVMSGVSSARPIVVEKDQYGLEGNQGRDKVNFGETTLIDDGIRTPANTPQAVTPSAPSTTQHHADPTTILVHEQNQSKVNLASLVGLEKDTHGPDSGRRCAPNYQSKITDPNGSGGKEIDVAPIISSLGKMNVNEEAGPDQNIPIGTRGGVSHLPTGSHDQFSPEPSPIETESSRPNVDKPEDHDSEKPPGQGGYAETISTATAVAAEKAMAAKDLVASKLGYGGGDQAHHNQQEGNLGDTRAEQTGYMEKISSAASSIAEKAAFAKDVVASKLGYGKKDESANPETSTGVETTKPVSPTGNKKGIVDTVAEKLTPVYAKVAGTSGIVTSKAKAGSPPPDEVKEGVGVQQQDKGISVKDYLGEKLKPGEEDKALSEMISGALHKKKEGGGEKDKVLGKVTESEEVKARLGTEEERHMSDGLREGVVEKLKGTVGSWFGKNEAPSHAPESHVDPNVAREERNGERRLQESTY